MLHQQTMGRLRLKRNKRKLLGRVSVDDEVHKSIAQITNTVKEYYIFHTQGII